MRPVFASFATRTRLFFARILGRLGVGERGFLVPLAVVVGVVTSGAAVGFHELIVFIRDPLCYRLDR